MLPGPSADPGDPKKEGLSELKKDRGLAEYAASLIKSLENKHLNRSDTHLASLWPLEFRPPFSRLIEPGTKKYLLNSMVYNNWHQIFDKYAWAECAKKKSYDDAGTI